MICKLQNKNNKSNKNVLDYLQQLPKDLKLEIWSFLGLQSLGKSPSASVFLDFTNIISVKYPYFGGNSYERTTRDIYKIVDINYTEDNRLSIDKEIENFNKTYENKIPHYKNYLFYSEISFRNWIIFNEIMLTQKEISESKYAYLDIKLIKLWESRERCEVCDNILKIEELKLREYQDWKCNKCFKKQSKIKLFKKKISK